MAGLVRTVRIRFAAEATGFAKAAAEANAAIRSLGDKKSGVGGLAEKFTTFNRVTGLSAPKLIAVGSSAGLAVQGVANLAAALAPLGGLLVALPAVAVAGAVAIGTLKLATSGFGDAVKAGFSGDAAKFAESIKDMAPAAQESARAVVALKPRLDELRKAVQQRFFEDFAGQVRDLGARYLPVLQTGLPRVADAMSGFANNFAKAARSGPLLGGVRDIIDATALGLARANDNVGPLTNAFGLLLKVAAPLVAQLGGGFATLTGKFADFIERTAASGQLAGFLQGALDTLRTLGQLLGNLGSIVGSIFSAANSAGGSFLQTLVGLTGEVSAFLKSAEGAAALKAIFGAVAQVGKALGTALGAVLPALGDALVTLAPAIPPVAQALAQIVVALAPLLPSAAKLAVLVLTNLAPAIAGLAPILSVLVGWVGKIVDFIVRWQNVIVPIVATVAVFAGGLKLASTAISAVSKVTKAFTLVFRGLSLAFSLSPIGLLVLAIAALAVGLVIAYKKSETFRKIVNAVFDAVKTAAGKVIDFFRGLPEFFRGVWDKITGFFTAAKDKAGAILDAIGGFFRDLPGKVLGFLVSLPGRLLKFWADTWLAVLYAVGYGIGAVIKFFIDLPGRALAAVRAIPGLLKALFTNAWSLAKTVVSTGVTAVVNFFKGLPGKARAALASLWGSISGAFTTAARNAKTKAGELVSGAVAIVKGLPGKAKDALGSMKSKIGEAFRGAGSWLVQAGKDILAGLASGIRQAVSGAVQAAKDAVGSVLSGAKSALGINSPSKVFRDQVGLSIPEGISVGITRGIGDSITTVKDAVAQLVKAGAANLSAVTSPMAQLPNVVKWGSVSEKTWDQLMAQGWKGRAGDGMEALYRPAGAAPAPQTVTLRGSDELSNWLAGLVNDALRNNDRRVVSAATAGAGRRRA